MLSWYFIPKQHLRPSNILNHEDWNPNVDAAGRKAVGLPVVGGMLAAGSLVGSHSRPTQKTLRNTLLEFKTCDLLAQISALFQLAYKRGNIGVQGHVNSFAFCALIGYYLTWRSNSSWTSVAILAGVHCHMWHQKDLKMTQNMYFQTFTTIWYICQFHLHFRQSSLNVDV